MRWGVLSAVALLRAAAGAQEATDLPYSSTVPGVSHACGHVVHTSVVPGAGIVIMLAELQSAELMNQPRSNQESEGHGRACSQKGAQRQIPQHAQRAEIILKVGEITEHENQCVAVPWAPPTARSN